MLSKRYVRSIYCHSSFLADPRTRRDIKQCPFIPLIRCPPSDHSKSSPKAKILSAGHLTDSSLFQWLSSFSSTSFCRHQAKPPHSGAKLPGCSPVSFGFAANIRLGADSFHSSLCMLQMAIILVAILHLCSMPYTMGHGWCKISKQLTLAVGINWRDGNSFIRGPIRWILLYSGSEWRCTLL